MLHRSRVSQKTACADHAAPCAKRFQSVGTKAGTCRCQYSRRRPNRFPTPCIQYRANLGNDRALILRSILEYILKKVLRDDDNWLSLGNNAIPPSGNSWFRIMVSSKCEPAGRLPYPDFSLLLKRFKATISHNLTNRPLRLCQARSNRGR